MDTVQTEGLKRDLPLWSSGLFPFFEYAATSVKVRMIPVLSMLTVSQRRAQPMLLDLYDTYYLPMQAGLRPIMKSFILALLPGLEEETGEFFDKVRMFGFAHEPVCSIFQRCSIYWIAYPALCRPLSSSKTSG